MAEKKLSEGQFDWATNFRLGITPDKRHVALGFDFLAPGTTEYKPHDVVTTTPAAMVLLQMLQELKDLHDLPNLDDMPRYNPAKSG